MLSLKEQLSDGKMIFLYKGFSMFPTFKEGDLLLVYPYGIKPIDKCDIIVFQHPELRISIVHRVENISGDLISTKGDNNSVADLGLISTSDALGFVCTILRKGKIISIKGRVWTKVYFLRNKLFRILLRLASHLNV